MTETSHKLGGSWLEDQRPIADRTPPTEGDPMSRTLVLALRDDLPLEQGAPRIRGFVVTDHEALSIKNPPTPLYPSGDVYEALSFEDVVGMRLVLDDGDRAAQAEAIARGAVGGIEVDGELVRVPVAALAGFGLVPA